MSGRESFWHTLARVPNWLMRTSMFAVKLARLRPNIVHFNPSLKSRALIRDGFNMWLAKRFGAKLLTFVRGWDPEVEEDLFRARTITARCGRYLLASSDRIIVLGSVFQDRLEALGIPISKTSVLPVSVDVERIRKVKCPSEAGSAGAECQILFLSRLTPEKGAAHVLRAAYLLRKTRPSFYVTIAGDGPERAHLEGLILELGLESHVEMVGYLRGEGKLCAYRRADIFILPTSHGEGFPNAIAEAMAAGLPVISTNVGGIPDWLDDGRTGYLLGEPGPEILCDRLAALMDAPELRRKMGAEAHRIAATEMDTGRVLRIIGKIYTNLLTEQ